MTPAEAAITETVRGFEAMGLDALRAEWGRRYGPPPRLRSVDLLRHLLAWRVQVEALGGLDRRMIRQIIAAAKSGKGPRAKVQTGVRIAREWQGRLHEVEAVEGGFIHLGKRYRSLSAIARAITGTRWNGPRFFGLRDEDIAA